MRTFIALKICIFYEYLTTLYLLNYIFPVENWVWLPIEVTNFHVQLYFQITLVLLTDSAATKINIKG